MLLARRLCPWENLRESRTSRPPSSARTSVWKVVINVFITFVHRARALRSATSSGTAVSPAATVSSGIADESSGLYLKQFVFSKAAQYRKLKTEWKNNVFLGRSNIQVSALIFRIAVNESLFTSLGRIPSQNIMLGPLENKGTACLLGIIFKHSRSSV